MKHCCILSEVLSWTRVLRTRCGILPLPTCFLVITAKGWEYYEVRFENDDFEQVTIPTSGPTPT